MSSWPTSPSPKCPLPTWGLLPKSSAGSASSKTPTGASLPRRYRHQSPWGCSNIPLPLQGVTPAWYFLHTQDTVVALQALAKYATLTYGDNGDFTVTVTSPMGTALDFELHNSNRLVLQRAALGELPGTYRVQARGQGCALVQVGTSWGPRPPCGARSVALTLPCHPR